MLIVDKDKVTKTLISASSVRFLVIAGTAVKKIQIKNLIASFVKSRATD